jgi:hypothetical protein
VTNDPVRARLHELVDALMDAVQASRAPVLEETVLPLATAAARGLSAEEVRKRWPRFYGPCPDCNTTVIHYASTAHYVLGDW